MPTAKKGAIALIGGLKTASVIVISGIGAQILAKSNEPSSVIFEHAKDKRISVGEVMQEFETGVGRLAALAALSVLTGVKLSKEPSAINRLVIITIGMVTFNILSNTQIVGKTLSYLSGEIIDPVDIWGRNLPSMMGVTIDPYIYEIALATAGAAAAFLYSHF